MLVHGPKKKKKSFVRSSYCWYSFYNIHDIYLKKKNGKKLMFYLHMKTNSSVFWYNIVFAIMHMVFYVLSFLYLSLLVHQGVIPFSVKMCLLFYIVCVYFINIVTSFTQIIIFNGMYTFSIIVLASGFC